MEINKNTLYPLLLYNQPVKYSEFITLYPVTMKDILSFQILSKSITVRKNSTFNEKTIIKMTYLDFLLYALGNEELELKYNVGGLSSYYMLAVQLLQLCCKTDDITLHSDTGKIQINGQEITPEIFDDLRRIIIIQNDIDFDIDEFIHHDTEMLLLKAQKSSKKDEDAANIEDYIDSLIIAMHSTEERIMNMSIRKFWRYIKRFNLHENYTIAKTGESTGMVKFKEPIKHWMCSIEEKDKYKHLKTDEGQLRSKIG